MMLSSLQSGLVVVLSVSAALLLVSVLNRLWPSDNRKLMNDVTGWQLGVLGTTYGVILGFMVPTDPRLSLEERYGTHEKYVATVKAAADRLVRGRFLLPDDADRLIAQADASPVLK